MSDFLIEILKGIVSVLLYAWPIFVVLLFLFSWQNRRKVSFLEQTDYMTIEIKIPKTNDKNPTSAEMMFATLHGILKPTGELVREGSLQEHISFEMVADNSAIKFYVWCPKHLKDFVEGQIYAQYPSAEINEVEDYSLKIDQEKLGKEYQAAGAEIILTKSDYLPIKTFNNFTVDPLAGITGVLSKLDQPGEEVCIQILARPVQDEWKRKGLNWVAKKRGRSASFDMTHLASGTLKAIGKFIGDLIMAIVSPPSEGDGKSANEKKQLSAEEEGMISAVELKAEKLAYEVKVRVLYIAETNAKTQERLHAIFGAFKQFNTTNLNGFAGKHVSATKGFISDYQNRIFLGTGYYLNIEELASIYHLPHTSVETPNISWTTSKTGEPPTDLPTLKNTPESELTVFAETNFRGVKEEFGIKRDDRRRHMYIIGKSGMGKTKLQESLVNRDIRMGEGVAVMDPHGDFIMDVLSKIPESRLEDVIIFDPADTEFPIAFNPMEVFDPNLKNQIASGVVNTFKKIFGTSWGPRLEYILNYTVLALLDTPNSTLLGIVNMLTDKNYRKTVITNIQDPVVKKFWTTEFASYNEKFATEAIAPILNKVGQFVANSLIRNVIGQPHASFNIPDMMDKRKILLINLSTGRVGETNAALLGSLMITAIQLAAMSRADIAEEDRSDFYLYVDEFQNFATESFKNILSEARKYHLNLTIAHQYIAQMEDSGVRDAIFGNVGTMITFRVGAEDANALAKEFNPPFDVPDLINLERQNIYIKMTIDGKSEGAFSAKTLTVNNERTEFTQTIIDHSRKLYTKPRPVVEEEVVKWSGALALPDNPQLAAELEKKAAQEAETTPEDSSDDTFEAPIVKSAGKARGATPSRKPADLKSTVAAAIAESTAHLNKQGEKPKETAAQPPRAEAPATATPSPAPVTEKPKTEEKPVEKKEEPIKIKDKIDKELLSEILKTVVTPIDKPAKPTGTNAPKTGETPQVKPAEAKKLNNDIKKSEPAKTQSGAFELNNEIIKESEMKISEKEAEKKVEDTPAQNFKSPSRTEKVITPENFAEVKAIHPHEVVKIVNGTTTKAEDLKEGETVKFE